MQADRKASRAMDGASRAVMDDAFCVFLSGLYPLRRIHDIQATCFLISIPAQNT